MRERIAPMGVGAGLAANGLMLAVLAYAYGLQELVSRDFYYSSVQEDEYLEWSTYWAFILAAVAFAIAAWRQWRGRREAPWFAAGLALFCFVVAMEEISWAQRVFGYRPPTYFLEHNFQQELNLHNVVSTSLRKQAFMVIIAGYGIALPLAMLIPKLGPLLRRAGLLAPPLILVPGFAVSLWTYVDYPWKFTGELVELMLGLGFLFAAIPWVHAFRTTSDATTTSPPQLAQLVAVVLSAIGVVGLGVANAAVSRFQRSADPDVVATARAEMAALQQDFQLREEERGRFAVRCGVHKRLYTYVEQYGARYLTRGNFVGLVEQGLPEERAEFLIDPWNNPYWVRSKCRSGRKVVFLYSFGPNRLRDSNDWELRDDDVGVYLLQRDSDADSDEDSESD